MITFCIVHYNTPELTTCLCSSIIKNHPDAKIIIFDNSDKIPFTNIKLFNITYYDNTKEKIIDFNKELLKYPNRDIEDQTKSGCNFGSAKHSMSIDWLCKNVNENFILMDSDTLLLKPIDFIDENYICCSDIVNVRKGIDRIRPMITYINVKKMKENHISFFDGNRMHALCKRNSSIFWFYDTGASFYEDVKKINLFKRIMAQDYIVHYGKGSWRSVKNNNTGGRNIDGKSYENIAYQMWLLKYKSLWKY